MTVYQATVDTIYYTDKPASEGGHCELRINGDEIVVSVQYPEYSSVYTGKKLSEGHYHLRCSNPEGEATLHRFEGSNIYEGYWSEKEGPDNEGGRGFWRIRVP